VIRGIGVDVIEVSRMQGVLERHGPRFLDRVFTPEEQALAPESNSAAFYAGRWAAKEAVSKTLGTGIGTECAWTDIVVLRGAAGQPWVDLRGQAAATARKLGIAGIHISISHIRDLACASAVAESA
jgi:holo-[acyl-carrier protein] synthase